MVQARLGSGLLGEPRKEKVTGSAAGDVMFPAASSLCAGRETTESPGNGLSVQAVQRLSLLEEGSAGASEKEAPESQNNEIPTRSFFDSVQAP